MSTVNMTNVNICCTMGDVFVELYIYQPVQLWQKSSDVTDSVKSCSREGGRA